MSAKEQEAGVIRNAIRTLVLSGGHVKYPFKGEMEDWFGNNSIFHTDVEGYKEKGNFVVDTDGGLYTRFVEIDDAVAFFCSKTFNRGNLGLAYDGIRKHKLTSTEFDDLEQSEIKALCQQYWDEHFATDYPEFA